VQLNSHRIEKGIDMTALLTTRVAILRRVILLGLAIIVAMMANAAAPATADAFVVDNTVSASYSGWVYVKEPPAYRCGISFRCGTTSTYQTAWRWSGTAWSQSSVSGGTQVYAYPYSGAWHWIWTQRTGWLAIETNKLERMSYSCSYWCA
jgi:hypothetical protein